MRLITTIVCFTLAGIAYTAPVYADDYAILNDPWRVYLGAFKASANSEISIIGDIVPPGPPIDVEEVLGLDDDKLVGWGGVGWHFARRHSVEFEVFTLRREATIVEPFSPPLQIGDTFIEAGGITTTYDTDVGRLTYGFSMVRSERSDFQLKAGLHIASLEIKLALIGAICDPTTIPSEPPGCPSDGVGTEFEDVTAPLPHLGLSYAYAFNDEWAFNITGIGFAIELDNIDGSLYELDADIAWQPWRNFGFGLGLRYFRADVESTGSRLNGAFTFDYYGPALYIQSTF
jgi:hypothetical protein